MPGTLDKTADLQPDVHIWTESAQKWVHIPEDVLQYRQQPDSIDGAIMQIEEYRQRKMAENS
jgi:hypothetical protein